MHRAVSLSDDLVEILVLLVVSEDLLDGFAPESIVNQQGDLLIHIGHLFVEAGESHFSVSEMVADVAYGHHRTRRFLHLDKLVDVVPLGVGSEVVRH